MISVLIADDQALVRAGFAALLEAEDNLEVCGEASDGEEAVRLARSLAPDIVLMDVRMPRMDGLEATRAITSDERLSATRVVVLTTFELDEYVFGALRAGASGFLLKDLEAPDLLAAIRVVAEGDALSPRGSPGA
jgi:DNA-binding NarL/FixJ family response regulator